MGLKNQSLNKFKHSQNYFRNPKKKKNHNLIKQKKKIENQRSQCDY